MPASGVVVDQEKSDEDEEEVTESADESASE
jgi:hypothetical protein